jgi:hypothetical protein
LTESLTKASNSAGDWKSIGLVSPMKVSKRKIVCERVIGKQLTWASRNCDTKERFRAEGLIKAAKPARNPGSIGHLSPPEERNAVGKVSERKGKEEIAMRLEGPQWKIAMGTWNPIVT